MKCIYCGSLDSKVVDSRTSEDGTTIRRRRECEKCKNRFTTYETIERTPIMVIKSNGNRQAFDPLKIKSGIIKSCEKRPVSMQTIEKIVEDIQKKIYNSLDKEVTTSKIGEMVMEELKVIDEVAYVRFASVYRSFKDVAQFMDELSGLLKSPK